MILVILAVSCLIMFLGCYTDNETVSTIGGTCSFITLIITIALFAISISYLGTDKKIKMYQEENQKIEEDIAVLVEQYMAYEGETFDKVTAENALTMVTLYPDLKTSDLVTKQIDIHAENVKVIKELKEDKINAYYVRWWLYFGH